ncbi:MAG: FAD-dependent oxidoreductase, partial [Nitrospinaceae bacterium]|nr:NAD(P)/FAD-dependent oxidoreductase [Nitrospinaceae bacterium]NIR57697.1 NAD(P)/FAD-dependent oxidoreductase [Nitrospinaceae bacterium]NIS88161.1 NAD(P)/FAD-dependent oxidoreductase [Nitrospinaceae bacterium]NIT85039.1 NAD(P)/FAD-dependent oxidoreductase [Nitrospinaceae bacterium]NIU47201.1 NAD(P)/FAD-dependent oxidoreductase [Nitrospinaceae bacterium]
MSDKNLLVLGGGPGGYTAAFLAADLGMQVTLVDAGSKPGGVCLHRGCIPSKALLHLAHLLHQTREAKNWGLNFGDPRVDLDGVRKWKNQVVSKMASGLASLCKQRGVRYVQGRGVFKDSHTVVVSDKETLTFDSCILAVGSVPVVPPMFAELGNRVLDSTGALEMEKIPERLLVVGGGYIGLEMGTVYAALGSRVTVVEMTDGLLPGVDRDLVRPLQNRLQRQFEAVHLQTRASSVENDGEAV